MKDIQCWTNLGTMVQRAKQCPQLKKHKSK